MKGHTNEMEKEEYHTIRLERFFKIAHTEKVTVLIEEIDKEFFTLLIHKAHGMPRIYLGQYIRMWTTHLLFACAN